MLTTIETQRDAPAGITEPQEIRALSDGTAMISYAGGYVLGVGQGLDRQWVVLQP